MGQVGARGSDGRLLHDRQETSRKDDPELCSFLTRRLAERLGAQSQELPRVVGPFRIIRYGEGGCISRHIDGSRPDPITNGQTTHTFIIYLSDCETDGETTFLRVPIKDAEV